MWILYFFWFLRFKIVVFHHFDAIDSNSSSWFVFFSLKNVKETPDERFYANLAKAASLMLAFTLGALMILAVSIVYMGSLTLYMGQIFISIAALICIFAVVYFILERRG